jgi:hypothetical protein
MKLSEKAKEIAKLQKAIDAITALQTKLQKTLSPRQYEAIKQSLVNARATINNMLRSEGAP